MYHTLCCLLILAVFFEVRLLSFLILTRLQIIPLTLPSDVNCASSLSVSTTQREYVLVIRRTLARFGAEAGGGIGGL